MNTHPSIRRTLGFLALLIVGAIVAVLITVFGTANAQAETTFTPVYKTCLWQLGPKSQPDPAHAFADPQHLVGCVDGTDGTTLALPTPACGVTIYGQGDHYTISSAADLVKFNALIKSGVLNSPADDGPFYASNAWWPTKTGAKCVTATPTPTTSAPTTTAPPVTSTPPVTTPSVPIVPTVSMLTVCGHVDITVTNTSATAYGIRIVDVPATMVPFSPSSDFTVAAHDVLDIPFDLVALGTYHDASPDTVSVWSATVPTVVLGTAAVQRDCDVPTTPASTTAAPLPSSSTPVALVSHPVTQSIAPAAVVEPLASTGAGNGTIKAMVIIALMLLVLGSVMLLARPRRH